MRIFEMSQRHRTPSIRMINLVDILLNLLIFFIASTTFRSAQTMMPTAVKVSLPEARSAEEIGKEKIARVVITVTPDSRVFLGKDQIGLIDLQSALRRAKEKDPDVVVELSADKNASYGTVVSIVDAARLAGVHNITAFTQRSLAGSSQK